MAKQQRKVALTGLKGTGKDYIADNILTSYIKLRIADNIKLECISTYLREYNLDFLKQDYITYSLNDKFSEQDPTTFHKIKSIYEDRDSGDLTESELLFVVNIFKNNLELKTRDILTNFLIAQDKLGYDVWVKSILKNSEKLETENFVIVDCRMIIEVIDFLLSDMLILNVYNSRTQDIKNIGMFHSTELIGVQGSNGLGLSLDITSRDLDYLSQVINGTIDVFYKSFEGYSDTLKNELKEIRIEVLEKLPTLEKNIDSHYNSHTVEYWQYRKEFQRIFEVLKEKVDTEYRKILKF